MNYIKLFNEEKTLVTSLSIVDELYEFVPSTMSPSRHTYSTHEGILPIAADMADVFWCLSDATAI